MKILRAPRIPPIKRIVVAHMGYYWVAVHCPDVKRTLWCIYARVS
jgi:hypothetical protein